jgi:CubicO group peptidase (beta-lactamase class C family)
VLINVDEHGKGSKLWSDPAFCDRFALMRILLVLCLCASLVSGASLPSATPEQAGFSSDRLNRINTVMKDHITAGRLNGASGLIMRNGKVIFRETWGAYKPDTIVRMYSMTKAVTGVAAMILYEEGKFRSPIQYRSTFLSSRR